jgi:hypothetical protein
MYPSQHIQNWLSQMPNYAIKGTSVEILDSFESSSGASVPYLGC